MILRFFIVWVLMLTSTQSMAAELRVAVASNFTRAMTSLIHQFEANTGHKVKLIFGSTGKHYAQINVVDSSGKVLEQGGFRYLAIANPKLAPYGRAARDVLQSRGLWGDMQGRIVRGENIGQSYQFVISGNAELGFVAFSQLKFPEQRINGSYWKIPQALYSPIEQQAVLIKDTEAGRSFLSYIQSKEALMTINDHGYETR